MTYYNSSCPVETTLQLISSRWKVLILRDLLEGTRRFGELRKSIGPVTQKVLTANLRSMERTACLRERCMRKYLRAWNILLRNWGAVCAPSWPPWRNGDRNTKEKTADPPPFPELNRTSGKTWKYSSFPFPARKVSGKFPSFYG